MLPGGGPGLPEPVTDADPVASERFPDPED